MNQAQTTTRVFHRHHLLPTILCFHLPPVATKKKIRGIPRRSLEAMMHRLEKRTNLEIPYRSWVAAMTHHRVVAKKIRETRSLTGRRVTTKQLLESHYYSFAATIHHRVVTKKLLEIPHRLYRRVVMKQLRETRYYSYPEILPAVTMSRLWLETLPAH